MKQEYITKEAAIEAFRKALDGGYVIQDAEQAEKVIRDIPAEKAAPDRFYDDYTPAAQGIPDSMIEAARNGYVYL